ncbi:MAG: class I SAM-dependent methyltransferase [Vicinamibacteraceae bacterium]
MTFIHRVPDREAVCRAYDFWSHFYDVVAAPWEYGARAQALATLPGGVGSSVLDVGIGPGSNFFKVAKAAGPGATVYGVDLSRKMVRKASRRLRRSGIGTARVMEADAVTLPFANESFDTVLSSYLLDLMPIEVIACALTEFLRVLKPSGRAVLVNLTKLAADRTTWYERCYQALPAMGQAYVFGGCRPVRLAHLVSAAGFLAANRTIVQHGLASEILVARKPAADLVAGRGAGPVTLAVSGGHRGPAAGFTTT